MADRVAVLIGNRTFEPDSGLAGLKYPALDVEAVAKLLRDPEIGRFDEVTTLVDEPSGTIKLAVERAFKRNPGAFVLIYYSGHGKVSDASRLYLAARDTHEDSLVATAVRFDDLIEMKESAGQARVGVVLDCCFAGLGQADMKGGGEGDELNAISGATKEVVGRVGGKGIFFIGASGSTQPAKEDEVLGHGLLTAAIVDGLKGGDAARDNSGAIRVSDLYAHCAGFIATRGKQRPVWSNKIEGEELIFAFAKPKVDATELAAIREKLKLCRDHRLLETADLRRLDAWFSRDPVPVAKKNSFEARFVRFALGELSLPDLHYDVEPKGPIAPLEPTPAPKPEPRVAPPPPAPAEWRALLPPHTSEAPKPGELNVPSRKRRLLTPLWLFLGTLAFVMTTFATGNLNSSGREGATFVTLCLALFGAYRTVVLWRPCKGRNAFRILNAASVIFLLALASVIPGLR